MKKQFNNLIKNINFFFDSSYQQSIEEVILFNESVEKYCNKEINKKQYEEDKALYLDTTLRYVEDKIKKPLVKTNSINIIFSNSLLRNNILKLATIDKEFLISEIKRIQTFNRKLFKTRNNTTNNYYIYKYNYNKEMLNLKLINYLLTEKEIGINYLKQYLKNVIEFHQHKETKIVNILEQNEKLFSLQNIFINELIKKHDSKYHLYDNYIEQMYPVFEEIIHKCNKHITPIKNFKLIELNNKLKKDIIGFSDFKVIIELGRKNKNLKPLINELLENSINKINYLTNNTKILIKKEEKIEIQVKKYHEKMKNK